MTTESVSASQPAAYQWSLPTGFPVPPVPADNPMSAEKVELGRYLFYDKRISVNGTESCASCHRQELAFTDGKPVAVGATGDIHPRSAMSLVNVAYASALGWNNPSIRTLEAQALVPLNNTHPVELGFNRNSERYLTAIRSDAIYSSLFPKAFPTAIEPFTLQNIVRAIACFERTIISGRSPYDRFHFDGDESAILESAKRGEVLFFVDSSAACFRCHSGISFSDATLPKDPRNFQTPFHNTGLYNLRGLLSYPFPNVGVYEYTKQPRDVGRFKTPTLRNIALTAPYMHDGSIPTLEAAVGHYESGGRNIPTGPNSGNGHENPNRDQLIRGFYLTPQNRRDLLAFLRSLTNDSLIHDPRLADPWPATQR